MQVRPLVLEGETIRLEPSTPDHAADLAQAVTEDTFMYYVSLLPNSLDEAGFVDFIQRLWAMGTTVPFTVIDKATGKAVGMTTYMDVRSEHKGLEIGMTWYAPEYRGTKVNPEAKLLLLTHAFETMGAVRVQLKCDARNLHSQAAIKKLGAVYEGTLRKQGIQLNGFIRDTAMFSIIAEEWPAVKQKLEFRLS